MVGSREDLMQNEIRRRALLRSDVFLMEHQHRQATRYTLDALEDVTGLPRTELESIADEVSYSFEPYETDFFSIKNQLVTVLGSAVILIVFVGLLIRWII
jgi:hypothetical protein